MQPGTDEEGNVWQLNGKFLVCVYSNIFHDKFLVFHLFWDIRTCLSDQTLLLYEFSLLTYIDK